MRVYQSEDIETLDDFVILDENLDQSDRFMNKIKITFVQEINLSESGFTGFKDFQDDMI